MNIFFLLSALSHFLKSFRFLAFSLLYSVLFVFIAIITLNYKSYISFITADYSIFSRLNILALIAIGSFSAMSVVDTVFLFLSALLFGVNTQLVIEKIRYLKKMGSLKFTFGAGILSLAVTGCASCGLSLASIAGLIGVIALLPFGGLELYILSTAFLILILFYNLQVYEKACKISSRK